MYLLSILSGYYRILITILLLVLMSFSVAAQKKIPKDFCISNDEKNLFEMVNLLRADYGKKKGSIVNIT